MVRELKFMTWEVVLIYSRKAAFFTAKAVTGTEGFAALALVIRER